MNLLRRGLEALLTAAAAVVLLAFIAWLALPRAIGWTPQVVLSGSMEPTLDTGSVAFVEARSASQIERGDVMTFRHPTRPRLLVTHRVVEVLATPERGMAFRTRGDANDLADEWVVPGANVVGVVRWSVPYLGYASNAATTPGGFAFVIALPAALVVVGELQSILRQLRARRREGAASRGVAP